MNDGTRKERTLTWRRGGVWEFRVQLTVKEFFRTTCGRNLVHDTNHGDFVILRCVSKIEVQSNVSLLRFSPRLPNFHGIPEVTPFGSRVPSCVLFDNLLGITPTTPPHPHPHPHHHLHPPPVTLSKSFTDLSPDSY